MFSDMVVHVLVGDRVCDGVRECLWWREGVKTCQWVMSDVSRKQYSSRVCTEEEEAGGIINSLSLSLSVCVCVLVVCVSLSVSRKQSKYRGGGRRHQLT